MAARNKGYFEAKNIFALNLVSSPGSGKTSILERTLADLKEEIPFYVIEGDQQTLNDANRIDALDIPVIQINTGKGCHLESDMVYDAVKQLNIKDDSILMIENVGNLVCPSMFNLGESKRVVIISTTEGEDKPIKYPDMFHTSDICIINKIDLLPYVNINIDKLKEYALQVNPNLQFFEVSATTGEGMEEWYKWLKTQIIVNHIMCLSIPGKLIEITAQLDETFRTGKVSFDGVIKEVSLTLVPEANVGDYVLVHVGAAISTIDEEEAKKTFELLKQLNELQDLEEPNME